MAFRKVFYALQEVFPQIDLRILKAVASQYCSDVDAAVEFVLSDVLPAVSEPTKTCDALHHVDLAEHGHTDYHTTIEYPSLPLAPSTGSSNAGDNSAFASHVGSLPINSRMEEHAQIEDKTVITESKTSSKKEYVQVGSSSTSEIEPPLREYEISTTRRLVKHRATENDEQLSKALPNAKKELCKSEGNYDSSDMFASIGSMSQLCLQNPSNSAIKCGKFYTIENDGQASRNLREAQNTHDLSKSEDNYNLSAFFGNFCTTESAGEQVCSTVPKPENTHDLHEPEENHNCLDLFGNFHTVISAGQVSRILLEHENTQNLQKSEDDYNLSDLFASSGSISVASHSTGKYGNCHTIDNEEQPSIDISKPGNITSLYDSADDFNLSDLFASPRNMSLSALENSKCEARNGINGNISGDIAEEKQSQCPTGGSAASLANEKKIMLIADNDKYLGITQPSQVAQISVLEDLIFDISESKGTLTSLYESAITKMKEVELHEENARQAKEAASRTHQDFLNMVDDFNCLIGTSKASNDKQAQKVQQEKSSLEALAQKLQARLTNMSAQRDEALAVTEEIKCTLDAKLTTAIESEAAAKLQITRQQDLLRLVREEKEATMERIMEESQRLQKEVEQNIMLREFLLDRGIMVDILQGDISSICKDVMALKERVNGHELLERSVAMASGVPATSICAMDIKCISSGGDPHVSRNENQRTLNQGLPQGQAVETNADCHTTSSDDDWEILNSTQD